MEPVLHLLGGETFDGEGDDAALSGSLVVDLHTGQLVSITGEAESAFLPGLLQTGAWALLLGTSLAVRWPVAGFVIGAVLRDTTGWRSHPAMLRLADRLTLVLLAPMLIRLAYRYRYTWPTR